MKSSSLEMIEIMINEETYFTEEENNIVTVKYYSDNEAL